MFALLLSLCFAGSLCADGWLSPSTGSGTCSHHGGIAGSPPENLSFPKVSSELICANGIIPLINGEQISAWGVYQDGYLTEIVFYTRHSDISEKEIIERMYENIKKNGIPIITTNGILLKYEHMEESFWQEGNSYIRSLKVASGTEVQWKSTRYDYLIIKYTSEYVLTGRFCSYE